MEISNIELPEIYFEPEFIGEGCYRTRLKNYEVDADDYLIMFDVELYHWPETNKENDINVSEIRVFDDMGEIEVFDHEYYFLHGLITKKINIYRTIY